MADNFMAMMFLAIQPDAGIRAGLLQVFITVGDTGDFHILYRAFQRIPLQKIRPEAVMLCKICFELHGIE